MFLKTSSDSHDGYMGLSSDVHERTDWDLPSTSRRLVVIFNPVAGSRRPGFLEAVAAAARAEGAGLEIWETGAAGDAERMAMECACAGRADVVVAAGGDGTINEVVNGLAAASRKGARASVLGIIPLGTANVLAHELGLPFRAGALGRLLATGAPVPVRAGQANGRLFTMMAGVGMDARVVAGIDPAVKRRLGKGAYALGSLREIMQGPGLDYRVAVTSPDGTVSHHQAASCIICNGHYYGGTFVLAPQARLSDAAFQVVLFQRPGRMAALSYAAAMVLGTIPRRRDVTILPALAVSVEGPAVEPVQGDGDTIAHLPLTVALVDGILPVLAPS